MTYERVRYTPEGGRAQTIILADVQEAVIIATDVLTGVEVNREGDEVAPRGVDQRRHVIDLNLISKRTVLTMDNHTGLLTEPGKHLSAER